MKNLLISFLFVCAGRMACAQIPSSGNVLWLRADRGVYNNNSGTQAILGDLVQVWEDQSGNGNHFHQDVNSYRPQLVAIGNTLCSQPLIRFDVSRRTYLGSAFKLSGPKTIFIVFLQPGLAGNPETLLSIKGVSNTYSEILCTDHPAYKPLSYLSEVPSSLSGGTTVPSLGNNISFSAAGNIFTMTYDGGPISSPSCYASNYNASPVAVSSSGLFGRLINDTSTIGGRAPEQNYSFLSGYIAEIIVYDRVLIATEISQVEAYLQGKYGFLGSCSVLPANNMGFTTQQKGNAVQLNWHISDETGMKDYAAEHSADQSNWDSIGIKRAGDKDYQLQHNNPAYGVNFYRLRINYQDGRVKYSEINRVDLYKLTGVSFSITPNPSADHFYIRSEKTEPVHIRILTAQGSLLKEMNAYSNSRIDISALPPAFYFINVNGKIEKFLKQ